MAKSQSKLHLAPKGMKINKHPTKKMLFIATPTLGIIRYEWAHHRFGQMIPVNWEASNYTMNYGVVGYGIDDAYNNIIDAFLKEGKEWLLIIEDDVLIPINCFAKMADYINHQRIPIVSGLYYTKSAPHSRPLIFRGRGNGAYINFEIGDKVWCDGLPFGCLLIHNSIIQYMYDKAEPYRAIDGNTYKRVIESPQKTFLDPETWSFSTYAGTQDLLFFDRIINENILTKTGWKKYARRRYPFLCDTSIFCHHIDLHTGRRYP